MKMPKQPKSCILFTIREHKKLVNSAKKQAEELRKTYGSADLSIQAIESMAKIIETIHRTFVKAVAMDLYPIARELAGFSAVDCDRRIPSNEYMERKTEEAKLDGQEFSMEDAMYEMENCDDCGNRECAIVRLWDIVAPVRKQAEKMMKKAGK